MTVKSVRPAARLEKDHVNQDDQFDRILKTLEKIEFHLSLITGVSIGDDEV